MLKDQLFISNIHYIFSNSKILSCTTYEKHKCSCPQKQIVWTINTIATVYSYDNILKGGKKEATHISLTWVLFLQTSVGNMMHNYIMQNGYESQVHDPGITAHM